MDLACIAYAREEAGLVFRPGSGMRLHTDIQTYMHTYGFFFLLFSSCRKGGRELDLYFFFFWRHNSAIY